MHTATYGGVPVAQMSREEFLDRWRYLDGEHVTVLGPSQSGKTTLGFQLLEKVTHPGRQAFVLCMKPRDRVVEAWGKQLGLVRARGWPPMTSWWRRLIRAESNGYLVWPEHTYDFEIDDLRLYHAFRAAMIHAYKSKRPNIVVADEAGGIAKELNLERALKTLLMRGSSNDTGCWEFSQRPVDMPVHGYSQAKHLFMHRDMDKRNRERLREIAGQNDPKEIELITTHTPRHHFLYTHQDGGKVVIEP